MKRYLFSVLFLSCCIAMPLSAAALETIENVTLVKGDPRNDGDSFVVKTPNGEPRHLRLYYVDSPEPTASTDAEWERVHEQQCHFGLEDHDAVTRFGKQAAKRVEQELSRPFTIRTDYVSAPAGREYAFIETHDGHDLGRLLVEQGLARVHDTRKRPVLDDTPSGVVLAALQGMHSIAILNRAGIWAETNVDRLYDIRKCLHGYKLTCDCPLDLNTASQECFQKKFRGIGPVKAAKIVAGRPYQSVDDLLNAGITKKTLEKIRPCLTVGTAPSNSTAQPE